MTVRRAGAVAVLVIASAVVGGVAVAVTAPTTVSACTTKTKAVRVLGTSVSCRASEKKVTWNIRGPRGPRGATGPTGPAGSGSSTNPLAGVTVMVAGRTCPAGSVRAFYSYGAVDSTQQDFGNLPYDVSYNSFADRYTLVKDAPLLPMSGCKF